MSAETTVEKIEEKTEEKTAEVIVKKTVGSYFKHIVKIFTPNKSVDSTTTITIITFWLLGTGILWSTSKSHLIPSPIDLFVAAKRLFFQYDLLRDLLTSLMLCVKAMCYS